MPTTSMILTCCSGELGESRASMGSLVGASDEVRHNVGPMESNLNDYAVSRPTYLSMHGFPLILHYSKSISYSWSASFNKRMIWRCGSTIVPRWKPPA